MNARLPLFPRWVRWGIVFVVGGYIFYASLITIPPVTAVDAAKPSILPLDKWRHFVAYAAFGGTLAYATADWHIRLRYRALAVILITLTYGMGIEIGQIFAPHRYPSVTDAYANAIGGLLILPWYVLRPRIEFRRISDLLPSGLYQ